MNRRTIATALAFASVFASSATASAYCRSTTCRSTAAHQCENDENDCPSEGAKLFWPTSCVSYAMNKRGTQDLDPDETRAVIKKAFQAWADIPCPSGGNASITFQERDPVECKTSQYNKSAPNVNVVLFQDDDWKYRGIDGTLAKTSVTYNDQTGEIYDADIEVNAANNTVTITNDPLKVEYDLLAILTHEAGHFIGIAHSPDPGAVMYASYSPGSTSQRTLTDDDVGAVCEIYPPNSNVVCNTEPKNGFSATCDGTTDSGGICSASAVGNEHGASGIGLAGAGLIFAVVATRKRRRSTS